MKRRAFTLIELLAVVVVIAIIATIGIYSVTAIMNKTREDSLNNTAFAVKKAASIFFSQNGIVGANSVELDMTPGDSNGVGRGAEAGLIDLGKDPWGKDYFAVKAIGSKDVVGKTEITVYLFTTNKDYVLSHSSAEILPLAFVANSLSAPASVEQNNNITITFNVDDIYGVNGVIPTVTKNSSPATAADYEIVSFNNEQIILKMKTYGSYSVRLTLERAVGLDSQLSDPVNFAVNAPPLSLTGTHYFGTNAVTINGLNAYSLSNVNSGTYDYFGYNGPGEDGAYSVQLRAFIRVIRRQSNGTETIISNWRQAAVNIGHSYNWVYPSATYSFPGWSNGNATDSMVVEVGLAHEATGNPVYVRKFTTGQLNATAVSPKTWTVYYCLDNDWDDEYFANFTHGSASNSRIVVN